MAELLAGFGIGLLVGIEELIFDCTNAPGALLCRHFIEDGTRELIGRLPTRPGTSSSATTSSSSGGATPGELFISLAEILQNILGTKRLSEGSL